MKSEPWVTLDDITRHLSVSRDTIYRWIDDRGLPAHRMGRQRKFKVSECGCLGPCRQGGSDERGLI